MTTNSPNAVVDDVQVHQMPALTEQERQIAIDSCVAEIAHLERCIKAYPDQPVLKVDLLVQQVALAALTAEPVAYVHPAYLQPGALGFDASVARLAPAQVALYTTPPAQLLRPVELPKEMDFTEVPAHYWDSDEAKAYASGFNTGVNESSTAIETAGYEVKND